MHIHSLGHEHGDYLDHTHTPNEASDHAHLSKAHYAHDTSHDHHDGVISEVDISPEGALKHVGSNIFAIASVTLLFILVVFAPLRKRVQLRRERRLILYGRYVLSPPLRAPPQH